MILSQVRFDQFVGRSKEIEFLLSRYVSMAQERCGSAALIIGEAGLGKSRLLSEFYRRLEGLPHRFVVGACHAYTRGSLAPFMDILKECAPSADYATLTAGEDATLAPADRKLLIFNALLQHLTAAAEDVPLVVVLEDLHWADSTTLELFEHLVRNTNRLPFLLVATFRSDAIDGDEHLVTLVREIVRCGASVVQLSPLSFTALRTLANSVTRSAIPIPGEVVTRVEDLSGGNPLYLQELLGDTLDRLGRGEPFSIEVPPTIKAMFLLRLNRLPRRVRSVLMVASVLGDRFGAAQLAGIAHATRANVVRMLQRAVEARIVTEARDVPDRYRFNHALIRETLYEELTTASATAIHRAAAAAFEASPDKLNLVAELAYHWSAAAEPSKALTYNQAAGEAAMSVGGYRDAVRFFRQALHYCSKASLPEAGTYDRLAEALYCDGSMAEAKDCSRRAIDAYVRGSDWKPAAELLSRMYGMFLYDADSAGIVDIGSIAIEVVEQLADPAMQAELLIRTATFLGEVGKRDQAISLLGRIDALQPSLRPDHDAIALLHCLRADANSWRGDLSAAIEELERALPASQKTTNHPLIAITASKLSGFYGRAGRAGDATRLAEYGYTYARRYPIGKVRVAWIDFNYARALFMRGRLTEAASVLERALEYGAQFNGMLIASSVIGIHVGLALGREDILERCADEEAITIAFETNRAWCVAWVAAAFAKLYAHRGRANDARALLHRAVATIGDNCSLIDPLIVDLLIALGAYGADDDLDQARHLADRLIAQSRGAYLDGYDWYLRALLALREGRTSDRRRWALAAAKSFESVEMPLLSAYALELAGRQRAALAVYLRIGALADAERLQRMFHDRRHRGGALTRRQLEIARLVADGSGRNAVATRLHISDLTLKKHVAQIYRRLGIHSRAELVAYLAQQAT